MNHVLRNILISIGGLFLGLFVPAYIKNEILEKPESYSPEKESMFNEDIKLDINKSSKNSSFDFEQYPK